MPKTSKIEHDKRLFAVQGWIVDGVQPALIIRQIVTQGWCERRQAERLLQQARKMWIQVPEAELEEKRKLKVVELQQLKRSLKDNWKGSPAGIMAIMAVEKEIIKLEGIAVNPVKKVDLGNKDDKPFQIEDRTNVPAALIEKLINVL